jgi:hypothetical protein
MTHHMMTRSKTRARMEDPDYDCLENNPRCPCGLLLSEDDMGVWEEDESKTPMCEACLYEMEEEDDSDEEEEEDEDDKDEEEDEAVSCDCCDEVLEGAHIFCLEKKNKQITVCSDCFADVKRSLKKEGGWIVDGNENWYLCQFCDEDDKDKIAGCCDNCPHHVEDMCLDCGTWYEKEEVWRCPDCAEKAGSDIDSEAEAADLDLKIAQARWNDLDNYTMMKVLIPNNEVWADLRLERQALNCYLKTTGKPWPKIRDPAACIAWCRAP